MEQELKTKIINWVKLELPNYIKECGIQEYRMYMIEDAEGMFAPGDQSLQSEVADLVINIINGRI